MADKLLLKEFFKNFNQVATIAPDSFFCIKELTKKINFENAKVIIEWGIGSGGVTKYIIDHKKDETIFISVEINKNIYERAKVLEKRKPNVFIINDDMFNTEKILKKHNIIKADYLLSTLPFSIIGFDLIDVAKNVLSEKGTFIQYLHSLSYFKLFFPEKELKKRFGLIEKSLVMWNLPPAIVYCCSMIIKN
jgi:phospholipid N-methyltransferase